MPFFEINYEDGTSVHYWQTKKYFYRRYNFEPKARRISEEQYMSAYMEYHNY